MRGLALGVAMAFACVTPGSAATLDSGVEVIDGDTVRMGDVVIRLDSIDAPELGQSCALPSGGTWKCAEAAAGRLEALTAGFDLACETHGDDLYGRIIATCRANGIDVEQVLVEEGLAWAFLRYSDVYAPHQERAMSARLGVWRAETEAPWDYRADRWEPRRAGLVAPGVPD